MLEVSKQLDFSKCSLCRIEPRRLLVECAADLLDRDDLTAAVDRRANRTKRALSQQLDRGELLLKSERDGIESVCYVHTLARRHKDRAFGAALRTCKDGV
uniref:Uncharacterized protein n=1 Tax=Calcidiscus leptoporus TaxID=127549 RepID=A0A7S0JL30_9EUKA